MWGTTIARCKEALRTQRAQLGLIAFFVVHTPCIALSCSSGSAGTSSIQLNGGMEIGATVAAVPTIRVIVDVAQPVYLSQVNATAINDCIAACSVPGDSTAFSGTYYAENNCIPLSLSLRLYNNNNECCVPIPLSVLSTWNCTIILFEKISTIFLSLFLQPKRFSFHC